MSSLRFAAILALAFAVPATSDAAAPKPVVPRVAGLKAFKSDAELRDFIKKLPPRSRPSYDYSGDDCDNCLQTVVVTGFRATPSITNNQEQGVDEGDIVKLRDNILVILRRGRLFTVSIAGGGMAPVDSINAYAPGVNAKDDWYDEMLVWQNRVIVIGYSYGRGGTEVNRFDLDIKGHLKYLDTYHLRSNDYYSSRNYASRLIGHQLIFYSPLGLPYHGEDPMVALPSLRRWSGNPEGGFERIAAARQVYVSPSIPDSILEAVHNVIRCDVATAVMNCTATSVIGPGSRVFYVSEKAVYLWAVPYWGGNPKAKHPESFLYRLPLDGSTPSAIGTDGAPIDQFSFREDYTRNLLTVVVMPDGRGDRMWAAERHSGPLALAYIDLDSMGDGSRRLELGHYRPLPAPVTRDIDAYSFHNRFIGKYLLYGLGNDWARPEEIKTQAIAVAVHSKAIAKFDLPHGVDRIEAMGQAGVIVGSDDKNLYFSAIELGRTPSLGDRYVMTGASQSETRSHGFFFSPASDMSDDGVLGLPIAKEANAAYRQLFNESASVLFLRRAKGKFASLGELPSQPDKAVDDNCVASCVDWYGNARPIFIGGRTLALMGYELVEGTVGPSQIKESGRANFAMK